MNDMIKIKLAERTGNGCSLFLPCALPELIQGSVPYFISYGEAEITFKTGNNQLDAVLKEQLVNTGTSVKDCVMLTLMLEKLNEDDKEDLSQKLSDGEDGQPFEDVIPVIAGQICQWHSPEEQFQQWLHKEAKAMRLTGGKLFRKVVESAKESGDWERFGEIEDYTLPEEDDEALIADYQFDLCAVPSFGGSEGIYMDCFIRGDFGSPKNTLSLGTMKTLENSLDACKVMGELCGVLLYHESRYANQNLHLFMPEKEIDGILSRPLTLRQAQEMEQGQSFPKMTM